MNDNRFEHIRRSAEDAESAKSFAEVRDENHCVYVCKPYPKELAGCGSSCHYLGKPLDAILKWAHKLAVEEDLILVETKSNGAVFRRTFEFHNRDQINRLVQLAANQQRVDELQAKLNAANAGVPMPTSNSREATPEERQAMHGANYNDQDCGW